MHASMTGEDGQIVDLKRRHLPAMIDLRLETQAKHHALLPELFEREVDRNVMRKDLKSYLRPWWPFGQRSRFARGWVIGETLAGYALFRIGFRADNALMTSRSLVLINDIAVHADWRGRGLARALLGDIEVQIATRRLLSDGEKAEMIAVIWEGNSASSGVFSKEGFCPEYTSYSRMLTVGAADGA